MLTLAAILLSTAIAGEYRDIERKKWESTPTVEICPDAKVSKDIIIEVIDYWAEKGYYVKQIKNVNHCDGKKLGTIQIMGARDIVESQPTFSALTHTDWYIYTEDPSRQMYIESAYILIKDGWEGHERTIKHELGHALGLRHHEDDHHIMHRYVD